MIINKNYRYVWIKAWKVNHVFLKNFTNHLVTVIWFWWLCHSELTHWGRVTHICVGKPTIIGSDNGLSPERRQAIIWTNAGILLIRTLGTNFSEILSEIRAFSFKKMHLKMSFAKWRPFCLGLNWLNIVSFSAFSGSRWRSVIQRKCTTPRTAPTALTGREESHSSNRSPRLLTTWVSPTAVKSLPVRSPKTPTRLLWCTIRNTHAVLCPCQTCPLTPEENSPMFAVICIPIARVCGAMRHSTHLVPQSIVEWVLIQTCRGLGPG